MAAYTLATPTTGKTHLKHSRLLLDSLDISGDSRQMSSIGVEYAQDDVTGYSNGVHYFTLGQATHHLNGYQAVFSNTATTGSHTELDVREEYITSYCFGVNAAPEVGSHAWLGAMEQVSYNVQGSEGTLIDVDFAKSLTNTDHVNPWGIVLSEATSQSGDVDLGSCDNIIASTNGLIAHLHVTATSGTTWTFDIESSSDNDDAGDVFASIGQFTANGAAVGSERKVIIAAGAAVEQYLRLAIVRVGGVGTVTAWVTVARGLQIAYGG
jgi:hypothetical protein